MDFNRPRNNNGFDFQLDKDWISIIILLLIPGIRVFGVFKLLKKMRKMLHLSGKENGFLFFIAALIITGSAAEILEGVTSLIIPLSIVVLAFVILASVMKNKDSKLSDYVSCIGDSASYDLDTLMSEMGVNEQRLRKDIAALKKKGLLPKHAYIDEGHRLLVLRPEGKPQSAPRPHAAARPQPVKEEPAMSEEEREYKEIILEIRALNVAIDDEMVSERIDRIEEITANIFHLVQQHPERKKDIQTFMEYYLPTTLKLLRQYARLEQQTVSGENITSSRKRIESILDKLVNGFEQQLDVLFKSEAIDITNDVKVLEKMMQMDGLA